MCCVQNPNAVLMLEKRNERTGRGTALCKCDLLQSTAQLLLLLLQLLLAKELRVPRLGVVDTALSLGLTLPASGPLVLAGGYWLCRVPVANALVSLVEKGVVWHVVGVDVSLDLGEAPVSQRVDLDHAIFCDLDDIQGTSLGTLAATTTSKDCLDLELGVGSLSGLDLGNIVVEFVVGVPKFVTMFVVEVLGSVAAGWLVHVDGGAIASSDFVDQSIRLIKVVECVQEDQVDVVLQGSLELGEHIHCNESSKAKGGCLVEPRQSSDAPFQDV
jgi:hypothetical protein